MPRLRRSLPHTGGKPFGCSQSAKLCPVGDLASGRYMGRSPAGILMHAQNISIPGAGIAASRRDGWSRAGLDDPFHGRASRCAGGSTSCLDPPQPEHPWYPGQRHLEGRGLRQRRAAGRSTRAIPALCLLRHGHGLVPPACMPAQIAGRSCMIRPMGMVAFRLEPRGSEWQLPEPAARAALGPSPVVSGVQRTAAATGAGAYTRSGRFGLPRVSR